MHPRIRVGQPTVVVLMVFALACVGTARMSDAVHFGRFAAVYGGIALLFLAIRLISALFYTPPGTMNRGTPMGTEHQRSVSFIIPCKNEEAGIRLTVSSCFEASVGCNAEVIVINDGSSDRTGDVLQDLAALFPNLTVVQWDENRGKRQAVAEGLLRAKHDVVIQMDSDTYLCSGRVASLLACFETANVGGVCIYTEPSNADNNLLTKMQAAYYTLSYRVLKAGESAYGTVLCLSGCASAYRRSAVLPHLQDWRNEQFLARTMGWGDDRGLTNILLRQGFRTLYTDSVHARTIVPSTLGTLVKQQIRWKKGWLVNSFRAAKFITGRHALFALMCFWPMTLVTVLGPLLALHMLASALAGSRVALEASFLLGTALLAGVLASCCRFQAPGARYWIYLAPWVVFYPVLLSPLLFYAALTIRDHRWGTR
jgi:hyaluronan synthase